MASKLMGAVLALDAYNRYYNEGIKANWNKIGNYIFQNIALPSGAVDISFAAAAYENSDGSTVISYRGTDQWNIGADPLNAFPIAAGEPFGAQFMAAFEFYHSVVVKLQADSQQEGSNIDPTAISLTGHSLGGGLAGLVAAFYGNQASLFANMPFELSVENAYQHMLRADQSYDPNSVDPYIKSPYHVSSGPARDLIYGGAEMWAPTIGANLQGYAVAFEALTAIRLAQTTPVDYLDPGTVDVISLDPGERHSMVLHTLLVWEEENHSSVDGWQNISTYLWNTYNSDAIGAAVGFPIAGVNGVDSAGRKMATAIAYSVVSDGERPFGDTAVRALFDDARDFGAAVGQDSSKFLTNNVKQDLANVFVQYSGLLAKNAVLSSANPTVANGVFKLDREEGSLSVDLSDAKWTFDEMARVSTARTQLVNDLAGQATSQTNLSNALLWYQQASGNSRSGYDLIGSVTFDLNGTVEGVPGFGVPSGQLNLIASIQGANSRTNGNSDELLLGSNNAEALWGGRWG